MYNIYKELLKKHGVKTVDVCNATGIPQNVMSNWKNRGGKLSYPNAKKIADYFGVTTDYLYGTSDKEEHYISEETAEVAQEILDSKELSLLFNAARDAKPEDLKTTYEMLLALKRKEQHNA